MGKKNLPSQNKSARKSKEKSQGKRLQNCNFSLSVCGAFRAVGGNTCGLKTSVWAGKLGKISLIPVREAGLHFFFVGSCKSAVPSWQSYRWDTRLLCQWVPSILSSITPFTLFLRRHMVKEMFCISAKYIQTNSKPMCIKGIAKQINIVWFLSSRFFHTDFQWRKIRTISFGKDLQVQVSPLNITMPTKPYPKVTHILIFEHLHFPLFSRKSVDI